MGGCDPGTVLPEAQPLVQATSSKTTRRLSRRTLKDWWPAIDPNKSTFLNMWDTAIFWCIVIVSFLAPVQAVFYLPAIVDLMAKIVLDAVFLLDMLLQFFVMAPEPTRPSVYSKDPHIIAKAYMMGGFWVDAVSVLPARQIVIALALVSPDDENHLYILQALRLSRLLRLARFSRLAQRWHTSFGYSFASVGLIKNFALVVICCHWMACVWSALAFRDIQDVPTWVSAVEQAKGGPDHMYREQVDVYVMSLYWAVVTLTSIGYGDICPQNRLEYLTATTCMALMACVWAYFIGAICGILSTLQPHEIDFKRSLDDLNTLLSERNVPAQLRQRLRRYFHECKDLNKHRIERSVIDRMSPALQGEVALLLHSQWLDRIWYLRSLNAAIVIWAARHLSVMIYAPKETILQDRTIFIVRRGVCARKAQVLVSGDVWGEDMLIHNEHLRDRAKTVSLSYLDVCMLTYKDVIDIVEKSPEAKSRLNWARIRIAVTRAVLRIASEITRLKNHPKTAAQYKAVVENDDARLLLYKDIIWGKDVQSRIQEYIAHPKGARRAARQLVPSTALVESDDGGLPVDPSRQMAFVMQKIQELAEAQDKSQNLIADMHMKMVKW